jgi:hypothetical protein
MTLQAESSIAFAASGTADLYFAALQSEKE